MNQIKVTMLCTYDNGVVSPAIAVTYANEVSTARVFAECHAKQQGAVKVDFPADFKAIPKKWQTWLVKRGALDVVMHKSSKDLIWQVV